MKVEKTMSNQNGTLLKSPWEFKHYGESGIPISDLFPHIGSCADGAGGHSLHDGEIHRARPGERFLPHRPTL